MNVVEQQIIEQLLPQLESEGFTVYIEPSRQILPSFMNGFVPDAIALREDKKIAFEILSDRADEIHRLDKVRSRFASSPDWELRILYARPASEADPLPAASPRMIADSLQETESLLTSGHHNAAVLIGWATLESIARRLVPQRFSRPRASSALVEYLATEGYVTPSEADTLRTLATARNELIHGVLGKTVPTETVRNFVTVLKTLFDITSAN